MEKFSNAEAPRDPYNFIQVENVNEFLEKVGDTWTIHDDPVWGLQDSESIKDLVTSYVTNENPNLTEEDLPDTPGLREAATHWKEIEQKK
jgi:hypothetical protein